MITYKSRSPVKWDCSGVPLTAFILPLLLRSLKPIGPRAAIAESIKSPSDSLDGITAGAIANYTAFYLAHNSQQWEKH